jgi:hypothetical protein
MMNLFKCKSTNGSTELFINDGFNYKTKIFTYSNRTMVVKFFTNNLLRINITRNTKSDGNRSIYTEYFIINRGQSISESLVGLVGIITMDDLEKTIKSIHDDVLINNTFPNYS